MPFLATSLPSITRRFFPPLSKTIAILTAWCAGLTLLANSASAQLTWRSKEIDTPASIDDSTLAAVFWFTNTGTQPVTITEVVPSCGCTTTRLEKNTYAPNEKGAIRVIFDVGDRVGLQKKDIMVRTDFAKDPLTRLTFRTTIPEILKIEPNFIRWEFGEVAKAKSVDVSILVQRPVQIERTETSDNRLRAEVAALTPGQHYRLTVTPSGTDQVLRGVVRATIDFPPGKPKTFFVPIEIGLPSSFEALGSGAPVQHAEQISNDRRPLGQVKTR